MWTYLLNRRPPQAKITHLEVDIRHYGSGVWGMKMMRGRRHLRRRRWWRYWRRNATGSGRRHVSGRGAPKRWWNGASGQTGSQNGGVNHVVDLSSWGRGGKCVNQFSHQYVIEAKTLWIPWIRRRSVYMSTNCFLKCHSCVVLIKRKGRMDKQLNKRTTKF